jgi:excisionase family DNA binding protein
VNDIIGSDLNSNVVSGLAVPTLHQPRNAGQGPFCVTVTNRLGFSGAIYDLDEQGRLGDVLPLLERYHKNNLEIYRHELKRHEFLDPASVLPRISRRFGRNQSVREWLESWSKTSEAQKAALETRQRKLRQELSEIDPRLLESPDWTTIAMVRENQRQCWSPISPSKMNVAANSPRTVADAMGLLGVSRPTIYRWIDEGKLKRASLGKVGGKRRACRILPESISKLLEESSE